MAFLSFYLIWFMFGGRDLDELRQQSSGAVSDQETWLVGVSGSGGGALEPSIGLDSSRLALYTMFL